MGIVWSRQEMHKRFWSENFEELDIDREIILKWVLHKQ
jgi:hypothetical protein